MKYSTYMLVIVATAAGVAFAGDVAPAQPTGLMGTLAALASWASPPVLVTILGFLADMVQRYFPSVKPAGILYNFRDAVIYIAKFINTLAVLADGVLKQNSSEKYNPPPQV
jgi:hypothetical protein